jgi:RNA-directed DNA polymerase
LTNNQKLLKRQKIRNAEYYDMQNIFDELYEQSNQGSKFTHLIELIQRPENIRLAYRNIRKNHGSRTAGTDNQTIKELNCWPERALIAHVQKKFQWYIPKSVRRVEIPKGNGKKRSLGIPTIMDRLIQQCILQVLEPICEAKFFKRNNGFRPNRSTEHAIAQAEKFMQNMNCHYVVDIDIKSFFDNVNHGKLLKQIWTMGIQDKKLLSILSSMLKAEIVKVGFPEKGTPQGGIISPLLSNIVLNELDWWIVSQWEEMPTKTKYVQRVYSNGTLGKRSEYRALRNTNLKECYIVRYADDFKIFCKTRTDAKRLFEATKQWLKQRLGLDVSPEKSKIVNLKRHYTEFLGFKLKVHPKGKKRNGSPKFVVKARMKEQALAKIHEKSKSIIKRLRQTYNKEVEYKWIQLYNAHIIGVHNYYSIATHVNLDFKTIAFDVKKSIYNRLKHKLHRDGVITNKYIKEKYGKSKEVRFISGIPIVPIAYVQHRVPLDKKKKINKYTPQGRLEIHKNLEGEYVKNLYYLMKRPVGGRSVEFNDNRIALFVAQRGNCAVMGTPLDVKKTDCHHIIRSKDGGDDSYQNLVVLSSAIHELIHATSATIIQKYLEMFTPNKKQLAKINKYRKILNLELLA